MFPILILDDAQADLILAERTLRNCKILNPILTFRSGAELLEYFTGEFNIPALVLTDMMMQPMTGNDVLKEMQSRGLIDSIPFVMVSGLADFKTLQEGYQYGARTFVIKPIKQDDILEVLSKIKGLDIHQVEDGCILSRTGQEAGDHKIVKFGT